MSVRAMFQVDAVTRRGWHGPEGPQEQAQVDVKLTAVYRGSPGSEESAFWDATPAGELTMTITNEALKDHFKPGHRFYLDFTPVEGD